MDMNGTVANARVSPNFPSINGRKANPARKDAATIVSDMKLNPVALPARPSKRDACLVVCVRSGGGETDNSVPSGVNCCASGVCGVLDTALCRIRNRRIVTFEGTRGTASFFAGLFDAPEDIVLRFPIP